MFKIPQEKFDRLCLVDDNKLNCIITWLDMVSTENAFNVFNCMKFRENNESLSDIHIIIGSNDCALTENFEKVVFFFALRKFVNSTLQT